MHCIQGSDAHRLTADSQKQKDLGVGDRVTEILSRVDARSLFPNIIGKSKSMRLMLNQILKVSATDTIVLITGETGTGKELIAQSIHEHSRRSQKPFVAINCAAIPEGLLESELFGHEKGAFTGANTRKPGKFEIANGGTVFLDEIGDMPVNTQAKVLRAIQEYQIEQVGGIKTIKIDVRFIAATNKNLAEMVNQNKFRNDLYFRLNVFAIHIPPLRERKEDIPLLAYDFLKQKNRQINIAPSSIQYLTAYEWPGNVRELKNAIDAAAVLAKDMIEPIHLPAVVNQNWNYPVLDEKQASDETQNLDKRLKELEKGIIIEALSRAAGVQVRAASILGIKERSLYHRIKKFDIDVTTFKHNIK
jgi:transcriptional regulator with GAF, ATPase, and Fis domain